MPVPHAPLSDAQWQAILPHLPLRESGRGRPSDLRAQFDAIFRLAASDGPWRELPEEYGKAGSVARQFRRLTHAGIWENLLRALAAAPRRHPLREIEGLICRATRRAVRLRGVGLIWLIRQLGLKRALPGPPWMSPNLILSELLAEVPLPALRRRNKREMRALRGWFRALRHCVGVAAGRWSLPRALRPAWP